MFYLENASKTWNYCPSGLGHCYQMFLLQTPLGAQPSLGAQPHYEAPGDPWVEYLKSQ